MEKKREDNLKMLNEVGCYSFIPEIDPNNLTAVDIDEEMQGDNKKK